jgi:signal transduction histidine kinase
MFLINKINILLYCAASFVLFFHFFVYLKNRTSEVNRSYLFFGISFFIWFLCYAVAYSVESLDEKLLWFRLGYVGVIFIPVTYSLFIDRLLSKKSFFLYPITIIGVLLALVHLGGNPLVVGLYKYKWGYYPRTTTPAHIFYLFFLFVCFSISYIQMIHYLFLSTNKNYLQSIKIKYVFAGSLIGVLSCIDFFGNYGIAVPPIGFAFIIVYSIVFSYAILKYRLMDVGLVVTRTSIFIIVYSIVLGFPFAIAFRYKNDLITYLNDNWWLVPMGSLTVLATAGPFIYLYIQKRAEEQLLKEQKRYQATLSQASAGMGRIKDLKRLLALIVYVVTRSVRLEHSLVYVFDDNKQKYVLGAFKRNSSKQLLEVVESDAPIVKHLTKTRTPIVYEEIKQRVQDYNDPWLLKIEEGLRELDAAVLVPSLIEDRLLAILVLGKKKSEKLYSEDDLSVFSILANQAALAIENAQFYEDVKKTHEQLFQAEKMATIGTMADGLSHQINNRLHALGFIAGDALDTVKLKKDAQMSDEMKEVMSDLEHSLVRIQENVVQGGEIVQGLLRYTRKGEEGFAPVEIDRLVTAALEMAQFKIKTHELRILREYGSNVPKIKGNFTQLQEVFFNMIDNAYDAMMQRKHEKKEPGYQPTLRIQAEPMGERIIIKFVDNGIGVKQEDFQKIFTPFFTTKLSSKKGTGLGLYVIKKIVDENHKGKVTFISKYMEGTTMKIDLPVAQGS